EASNKYKTAVTVNGLNEQKGEQTLAEVASISRLLNETAGETITLQRAFYIFQIAPKDTNNYTQFYLPLSLANGSVDSPPPSLFSFTAHQLVDAATVASRLNKLGVALLTSETGTGKTATARIIVLITYTTNTKRQLRIDKPVRAKKAADAANPNNNHTEDEEADEDEDEATAAINNTTLLTPLTNANFGKPSDKRAAAVLSRTVVNLLRRNLLDSDSEKEARGEAAFSLNQGDGSPRDEVALPATPIGPKAAQPALSPLFALFSEPVSSLLFPLGPLSPTVKVALRRTSRPTPALASPARSATLVPGDTDPAEDQALPARSRLDGASSDEGDEDEPVLAQQQGH
ncbi:hypothetical protein SCUCBS95973_009914, partial [Sporothrix curviconia]